MTLWPRNPEVSNGSVSCGGASSVRSCTQRLFGSSFLLPGGCQGVCCQLRGECGRALRPPLLWGERARLSRASAKILFPPLRSCWAFPRRSWTCPAGSASSGSINQPPHLCRLSENVLRCLKGETCDVAFPLAGVEWGLLFPSANGEYQSPINLNSREAQYDPSLLDAALAPNYVVCRDCEVVNDGHTVRILLKSKSGGCSRPVL